jgi:hypothetical protein
MSHTVGAITDADGKVELLESMRDESAVELGSQQMAQDEARESEALEWAEATIGDVADDDY